MRSALLWGAITLGFALAVSANAEESASVDLHSDELEAFQLELELHYKSKPGTAAAFQERGIPADQLPVVFYISHHARVTPKRIVDLRLSGKSWNDITLQVGHHAGLFHVQTVENHGPPYGRALGYYRKYPEHEWSKIKLTDKEVIGLVNIKFIAARFDYNPDQVLKLHIKGESLVKLHGKIKAHKTKPKRAVSDKRGSDRSKGTAKDQKKTAPKQPSKKRGGKNQ